MPAQKLRLVQKTAPGLLVALFGNTCVKNVYVYVAEVNIYS